MSLATINEYEKKPSNGLVNGGTGIQDLCSYPYWFYCGLMTI